MNLQNRGVYYYNPCLYIKIAEPAFVVVETCPSFDVALRQTVVDVVVAAAAVADSAVIASKLKEFVAAAAVHVLPF